MSKAEILAELPKLSPADRAEISRRLAQIEEESRDLAALRRAEELSTGRTKPLGKADVFGRARKALG